MQQLRWLAALALLAALACSRRETGHAAPPKASPPRPRPIAAETAKADALEEAGESYARPAEPFADYPREVLCVGLNVSPPVKLHAPKPRCPNATGIRYPGRAVVESIIDAAGRVARVRIKSASHSLLGTVSRDALAQWQFSPAHVDGRPVDVYFTLTVNFRCEASRPDP